MLSDYETSLQLTRYKNSMEYDGDAHLPNKTASKSVLSFATGKSIKRSHSCSQLEPILSHNRSTTVRILAQKLDECRPLAAYLLFSITLYLTALAVFRRRLLSLPFEGSSATTNWTSSDDFSNTQVLHLPSFKL
uniref:Cation/H+ exchanger domain-containing protein n=1 Tax=Parascaris univalens TaxID=6257 RepID=A0A915C4V1_PARUN